jgi:transcriptional regulator with XRE-family HTH domain
VSYAEEVGARLRRVRMLQGLSLQDVERRSDGEWKAAVVGSYERGDRNITAARLVELAGFYGVPPSEILPQEDRPRPPDRSAGVVIDLVKLADADERFDGLRRWCDAIQAERGDYNRQQLSIRGEDLRSLAVVMSCDQAELVELLEEAGLLQSGS